REPVLLYACLLFLSSSSRPPPRPTPFPYTTLFRSGCGDRRGRGRGARRGLHPVLLQRRDLPDGDRQHRGVPRQPPPHPHVQRADERADVGGDRTAGEVNGPDTGECRAGASDVVPTGQPLLRTTPRSEGAPMAGKKLVPSSGRAGSAFRAAQWALPLLAAGARWLSAHPEVWERVKEQAARLQKPSTSTPDGVLTTTQILREQVDYLRDSADDDEEARRAQDWAKRLDSCERAAQLLKAPGATRKDRKALRTRVEALRSEIFAAYIEEMGEDAQAAEPPYPV